MRNTRRTRRAGLAALAAIVIGGSGFAVGAGATASSASGATPAATPGAAAPAGSPGAAGSAGVASYADVVRQVLPWVVLIRTSEGLGSGVVLDRSGNIVTNAHVAGSATKFQVQEAGDTAPRSAHLVGTYPPDDLAVIRADDPSGLQPATFGNSDQAQAGDVVLAIGNPLGSVQQRHPGDRLRDRPRGHRAGRGGLGRGHANWRDPDQRTYQPRQQIQTSAPINPGNSGGALVSASGQVIGIPTLAAASPQSGSQAQGIGFAVPSNLAREIASQIIDSGHVTNSHRAALGAEVATVLGADGSAGGVGVVTATSGGAADHAGLRPGDKVTIKFSRAGQERTVQLTLGELPSS